MAKLITAASYLDLPDAHVARALLDSHGIPVFLFDDRLGGTNWFFLPALGGVRLMVPDDHLDVAGGLICDLSKKIDVPEDEHCPSCSSDDLFRPASWVLLLLSMMVAPLLVQSRRRRCRTCGHDWRGPEGFLV